MALHDGRNGQTYLEIMMQSIHFSIDIKAPKKKVWKVLWDESSFRDWSSVFAEGKTISIKSDWKEGGRFEYFESNVGSYGIIERLVHSEHLLLRHRGELREGKEHPYKEDDRMEQYRLTEKNGVTTLTLDQDVPSEHKKLFEEATPRAFERIRELAEQTNP